MKASALLWALLVPSFAAASSDPYFPRQWALSNDGTQTVAIDVDDLHTVLQSGTPGVDIGWTDGISALSKLPMAPVTVAVIDSGVDPAHPDLQGRLLPGFDFLTNSATLIDPMGHGTHVTGIIAASANNAVGIAGVAPASVMVMPLRVLSDDFQNFAYRGKLISDYAADAIRYAVAHHAQVIQMSFGWPELVDTANARAAVQSALAAGVLVVTAAGNDRKIEPTYPCSYPGVLCVGAISNTGAMSIYSNHGGTVDVLAPGDDILSTYPLAIESTILRIQGYELLSGTSQAAPHVSAIAASLLSANPALKLDELRARLMASAAPLPTPDAALYGRVSLVGALTVAPQPVFLPSFKASLEVPVNETTLLAQGSASVAVLWQDAAQVSATVTINGRPSGAIALDSAPAGTTISVPWQYQFASLDDASDLSFTLTLSDSSGQTRSFQAALAAVRALDPPPAGTTTVAASGVPAQAWLSQTNGHLFSRLRPVDHYGLPNDLPRYYQQTTAGPAGSGVQFFDPGSKQSVAQVLIPGVQQISQVIRLAATADGSVDWVVTGLGLVPQASPTAPKQYFWQFYFLDGAFQPLWGAASSWQIPLDPTFGKSIVRNYASTGSWIRLGSSLVPSFTGVGLLPPPDNFNSLDPRHYTQDMHLYYLAPANLTATPPAPVSLTLRALDNATFRTAQGQLHLQNVVPQSLTDAAAGHLRALLAVGEGIDSQSFLWDLPDALGASASAPEAIPGWDPLSSSGQAVTISDLGQTGAGTQAAFLNFYDTARGSLAWSGTDGSWLARTEFTFSDAENPISGLIGAFAGGTSGDRYWFLETRFDLVGFHQDANGTIETRRLPIERDSSFPGGEFSELFTPVVLSDSAHPMAIATAGVFIDSTLVRGDRVSVAVWNSNDEVVKPLRNSMAIPPSCVEMPTLQQESGLILPLICQKAQGVELQLIRP